MTVQVLNLSLYFDQLVARDLEGGFGVYAHLLDHGEGSIVLGLDFLGLLLSIPFDLIQHLSIVRLHGFNFLSQLVNKSLLLVYVGVVVRLIHVDRRCVFLHDFLLGCCKRVLVSFLLVLKLSVASSILQHLLVVLIPAGLQFLMLLLLKQL